MAENCSKAGANFSWPPCPALATGSPYQPMAARETQNQRGHGNVHSFLVNIEMPNVLNGHRNSMKQLQFCWDSFWQTMIPRQPAGISPEMCQPNHWNPGHKWSQRPQLRNTVKWIQFNIFNGDSSSQLRIENTLAYISNILQHLATINFPYQTTFCPPVPHPQSITDLTALHHFVGLFGFYDESLR